MTFEISSEKVGKVSHCGVLEFVANEGEVWMPRWVRILIIDMKSRCILGMDRNSTEKKVETQVVTLCLGRCLRTCAFPLGRL